jgi:DNA-binding NarL/FixJ family response regulator
VALNQRSGITRASAKDFSVLIAVEPKAFHRLIEHVLHGHAGLRVVGSSYERTSSTLQAAQFAPDVIIVSTRVNGKEPRGVLADLKRSSPASTLVLLTHCSGGEPHQEADACLPECAVVKRLLPVIRKAARGRDRVSQPASAGLRT